MKFLPILVPCTDPDPDGTVNGEPVRVVPYSVVDLLIKNRSEFLKKYGDIPLVDAKLIRGVWNIIHAVRSGRKQEIENIALALAELAHTPSVSSDVLSD